ncbi:hypothetical protein BHE74_00013053 [Ensete ventricosum]|nr:hypothetical protein BHE74_00013053 [Ensete ventricosum]
MASSQSGENVTQCKNCRCGEADTKFWITRASDNPDKQTNTCPNCNVSKILLRSTVHRFHCYIISLSLKRVSVLKSGPLFISSKGSFSAVKPFLC